MENSKGFFQNIETLQQAGVKNGYGQLVGGIGTEHYPTSFAAHKPSDVIAALQGYAVTGLPQTLTEFGAFSGVSAGNAATILGDCMRLEFGNPMGTGFFMWGFQAEDGGGNLFAPSTALYSVNTSDWSKWTITQSGKKWQDLLGIQDWDGNTGNGWNTQLTANTAADGTINFNGYYGDYVITIGGQNYNLTLKKGTSRYTLSPVVSMLGLGQATAAPEPGTMGLLLMGSTFAVLLYRNRGNGSVDRPETVD
jgi:hypothetical protein